MLSVGSKIRTQAGCVVEIVDIATRPHETRRVDSGHSLVISRPMATIRTAGIAHDIPLPLHCLAAEIASGRAEIVA